MKSILVINDSSLFRDFLGKQLGEYGFKVVLGINGLDGWSKIRGETPDLIIMDYSLSRKSSTEILKAMLDSPNIKGIPVVMTCSKLEKTQLMDIAKMGVKKILNKPLRIDALLNTLQELLSISIEVDQTPCILDAHLNDQILFVEIAKGFNREKINLLHYKIAELLKLYSVEDPRILVLLTDINFRQDDAEKLESLLEEVLDFVRGSNRLCVLTVSEQVKNLLNSSSSLEGVGVAGTIEEAMDRLLGIAGMESLTAEQDTVQQKIFSSNHELQREFFQLNFEEESGGGGLAPLNGGVRVAAVDDDLVVREIIKTAFSIAEGWEVIPFANGAEFVEALENKDSFDLLFLDLIMPEMNGFAVLQLMLSQNVEIPTIILTAMSRKESVVKAREFGVNSYLIKPIKSEEILAKAAEIFGADF